LEEVFTEEKMLVCTKCRIEHEEGKKFCWSCGNPLVAQEKSEPIQENLSGKPEEKGQGILICPNCKWAYEWGTFCTKCGSALGSQLATQPQEDPNPPPSSAEQESPPSEEPESEPFEAEESPKKRLVCPSCKIIYEGRETCIRCGSTLTEQSPSPPPPIENPPVLETLEAEKEDALSLELNRIEEGFHPTVSRESHPESASTPPSPFPPKDMIEEGPEQEPAGRTKESRAERKVIPPRKKRINFRRLPLEALSILILVVAGGYLLWSLYTRVIMKKSGPDSPPPQASSEPSEAATPIIHPPSVSASSGPVPSVQPTTTESQEIEEIRKLLEMIRKANLEKNIDLFMSCYASDFKDREGKKKDVLNTWKDFTYQELSFDLKKESVSNETAQARVEWLSRISSAKGGKTQDSKTLLDVSFKKEENRWKIKETKVIE
jgi:hypothetical protein